MSALWFGKLLKTAFGGTSAQNRWSSPGARTLWRLTSRTFVEVSPQRRRRERLGRAIYQHYEHHASRAEPNNGGSFRNRRYKEGARLAKQNVPRSTTRTGLENSTPANKRTNKAAAPCGTAVSSFRGNTEDSSQHELCLKRCTPIEAKFGEVKPHSFAASDRAKGGAKKFIGVYSFCRVHVVTSTYI